MILNDQCSHLYNSPLKVLAVMLANGRQAMVERAVRSFRAQTYPAKVLIVLDTGMPAIAVAVDTEVRYWHSAGPRSIGELRNLANATAIPLDCEVIAHWDSDDWSHPERLSEQVAFLQSSGKQAVGYREVLFWNTWLGHDIGPTATLGGEAWLFSSPNPAYCIGASLCYWVKTWLKRPLPDKQTAEDTLWWLGVKAAAQTAVLDQPRMICAIHGANTASKIQPGVREWRRAPEWDAYCREVMNLNLGDEK